MTKKILLFLISICLDNLLIAQTPNLINYQGVAINSGGLPISNQTISIRARIRGGAEYGGIGYGEERLVTTDAGGLFDFQIGSAGATNVIGSMGNINWSGMSQFLQIEMDPAGGTNYTDMGSQQLAAVPYAFESMHANSSTYAGSSTFAGSSTYTDSLSLPYTGNDNTINSFVVNNYYNGAGIAIKGTSFTNNANAIGVYGVVPIGNTAGTGVRGQAFNNGGIALEGVNTGGGIAVRGKATGATGVAVYAENTNASGKALDVNGNVKIAGGNTNPSAGAVLTSDASGNAIWKKTKIGFVGYRSNLQNISHNSETTLALDEVYDGNGDFNPNSASSNPNTFTAPVTGLYHFSAKTLVDFASMTNNLDETYLYFYKNGIQVSYVQGNAPYIDGISSHSQLVLDQDLFLNAGDKLSCRVLQTNSSSSAAWLFSNTFTGHLVFAE